MLDTQTNTKTNIKADYKLIYMLSLNTEDKLIEEFRQKIESEINRLEGCIKSSTKERSYMVKTSSNKGLRNICLLTVCFVGPRKSIKELTKFLKLASDTVLNYLILKEEQISKLKKLSRKSNNS